MAIFESTINNIKQKKLTTLDFTIPKKEKNDISTAVNTVMGKVLSLDLIKGLIKKDQPKTVEAFHNRPKGMTTTDQAIEYLGANKPKSEKLADGPLSENDLTLLTELLKDHPEVTTLRLGGNQLDQKKMILVANLLKQCPHITEVDLSNNHLGSKQLKQLAPSLYHVEKLDLSDNFITKEEKHANTHTLDGFSLLVEQCPKLQSLSLKHNELYDVGLEGCVKALQNSSIQEVDLEFNHFQSAESIKALSEKITALNLHNNPKFGSNFISALQNNKNLNTLILSRTGITDGDIKKLTTRLVELKTLVIGGNKNFLTDASLKALENFPVINLDLSYNTSFTQKGLEELLQNNKYLRHLDISNDFQFDDRLVAAIQKSSLVSINLSNTSLSEKAQIEIGKILQERKSSLQRTSSTLFSPSSKEETEKTSEKVYQV